jgi:hypothetical protein
MRRCHRDQSDDVATMLCSLFDQNFFLIYDSIKNGIHQILVVKDGVEKLWHCVVLQGQCPRWRHPCLVPL